MRSGLRFLGPAAPLPPRPPPTNPPSQTQPTPPRRPPPAEKNTVQQAVEELPAPPEGPPEGNPLGGAPRTPTGGEGPRRGGGVGGKGGRRARGATRPTPKAGAPHKASHPKKKQAINQGRRAGQNGPGGGAGSGWGPSPAKKKESHHPVLLYRPRPVPTLRRPVEVCEVGRNGLFVGASANTCSRRLKPGVGYTKSTLGSVQHGHRRRHTS